MKGKAFILLVFLSLSYIFLTGEFSSSPAEPVEPDKLMGAPAPNFFLKNLSGKDISLNSFRGKIIILNFWASWCPPCKDELPTLSKLYMQYKDRGLEVIGVSTDASESKVKDFLDKSPVSFTVLIDKNAQVARKYRVYSIPTTFLIDKKGVIIKRYFAVEDWTSPEIIADLEGLLK